MKLIILIGLLLSVTAVAPKSIEQKAAGIAEQRARQLDQGPATFESRDENGEEQVLQKMLRIRQAVQEADSELIQAEREAADPQADFNLMEVAQNFIGVDIKSHVEKFLNSDMAKGLKNCFIAAGKDVMEAGISAITEQIEETLKNPGSLLKTAKGIFGGILGGKEDGQEAFKKAMEELVQAKREAADPHTKTSRQDFDLSGFTSGLFGSDEENSDEENSIMEQAMKCMTGNVSPKKIMNYIIEKNGLGLKRSK